MCIHGKERDYTPFCHALSAGPGGGRQRFAGSRRALCGDSPGIACILGTGSNSCLYDGKGIVKSISPLGFVLGDEGSGAVLGKLLVGDVLKNQLPAALQEAFWAESGLTPAIIMEKVYKGSFPNRFLASLSPFLLRHIEEPAIRDLVSNSFRAFFARQCHAV